MTDSLTTVLADSVATHHAAVQLGQSAAGWLMTHIFTNMPANVAALAIAGLGTVFGLAASWIWHRVFVAFHGNSAQAGQAALSKFWEQYGRWLSMLLSALVTGWTTKNYAAALLPVLAQLPSAAFAGVSSTLSNQNPKAVMNGRNGALVLFLCGASLLAAPRAQAAGTLGSLVAQPVGATGAPLPWLSWQRTVYTLALGEHWTGPKWTDHPVPYARVNMGYQVSAPVQFSVGFERDMDPHNPWRLTTELRLIGKP